MTDDKVIYFQEIGPNDIDIARYFGVKYIGTKENIGIGQALLKLASGAKHEKILLLEHDWELIEKTDITKKRINQALHLLDWGYDCVRLRHRSNPGFPHFSERNYTSLEKAFAYHDPEIDLDYPHLLDAIHWCQEPDRIYKGKIGKQLCDEDLYYAASSRYGNFTNNPCMYRKDFYIKTVKPYVGKGIELEGKISYDWARANYNVVQGDGLFTHFDPSKYGNKRS